MRSVRLAILLILPLAFVLTGCPEKQGPMEKAGEKIDEAVNDAEREVEDALD